jgi:hypothetical protein
MSAFEGVEKPLFSLLLKKKIPKKKWNDQSICLFSGGD